MSFNVNFYTFSKKQRSTAVPSGTGKTVSCHANQTLDILEPEIILDWRQESGLPTVYNYARISDFGRWYRITGWKNDGGIWSASLRVDSLASWKTQIGANSIYIYRSSVSYNNKISDSLYPQKAQAQRLTVNLPKVWTVGGANAAGSTSDSYTVVAGIIGQSGTSFYAFTPQMWATFYNQLFSNQYYIDVLGKFGATEYPEAKVAVNPLQYISSVMVVPLGMAYDPNTNEPWRIPHQGTVIRIPVGNVYVPSATATATDPIAWRLTNGPYGEWTHNVEITTDFVHPQADERGDWLNFAPATSYEVFYPPLGSFPLEASTIAEADYIDFTTRLDYRSGVGMLDISARYVGTTTRSYPLYRSEFNIGAPIQVSNVLTPGASANQQSYYEEGAAISAFMGNFGAANAGYGLELVEKLPVVGGLIASGIQSAIHNMTPRVSSTGKFGSTSTMGGQPRLIVTHWLYADDDLSGRGRPLCQIRLISDIPGYIRGDADEIAVPCYESELGEIQAAIAVGFYYE